MHVGNNNVADDDVRRRTTLLFSLSASHHCMIMIFAPSGVTRRHILTTQKRNVNNKKGKRAAGFSFLHVLLAADVLSFRLNSLGTVGGMRGCGMKQVSDGKMPKKFKGQDDS
jgi:hypothetical protein